MLLSIITINYNNLAGLKKTAESIVNQTYTNYEWIIIDGGSTDGSKEVIESLTSDSLTSNLISYWCSEPDKGIFNAMNKGITHATGKWVNFMNSGDVFNNKNTLINIFTKEYDCDVIYGDCYLDFSGRKELRRHHHPVDLFDLIAHPLCHQAMFYKTVLLQNCGYDETLPYTADCVKNIEMLAKGYKFHYIDNIVCVFAKNGVSSMSSDSHQEEFHRGIKKHVPEYALDLVWRLLPYADGHLYHRLDNILKRNNVITLFVKGVLALWGRNS